MTFAANAAAATLSVPTVDDETAEDASTVTATVTTGIGYTVDADAGSASGTVESEDIGPITARFTLAPAEHDGSDAFEMRFAFSHAPTGYNWTTVRDRLFEVTGGRIEKAGRLVRGSNLGWKLRVRPDGLGPVTLDARATTDCAAQYAACDATGRKFDGELRTTVLGPPTLSVADAEVEEADGATLDFVVTLSRAVAETVTVAYATSDGTAAAGDDYIAVSGSLSFAANEVSKTVSVSVLDDPHDEGSETVRFTLSDPRPTRVKLEDAEATGTITNNDAMPRAWIARFGRTVGEQVLDAVEGRMRAGRRPGAEVSLGGERIGFGPQLGTRRDAPSEDGAGAAGVRDAGVRDAGIQGATDDLASWLQGATADPEMQGFGFEAEPAGRARTMSDREVLLGSSFSLTGETADSGVVSLWGRGTVTRFDGRDGDLTVDGEVASAMLGADWSRGRVMAGLIVGQSLGEGGYRAPAGNGVVRSTLTGVYPWGRHALTERLEVWGAAGYGAGTLTLTPEGEGAIRTDLDLWMAAAGLRGVAIDGGADGLTLLAKTDAMTVETSTEAVPGDLAASEAGVTRLRLGLEGTLPVPLADGSVLTPGAEIGVRRDGGDAETGTGVELGGRVSWTDPGSGLSVEANVRALVAHEDSNYREWGASGAVRIAPGERGRGLSFSLAPAYGTPSGGVDRLWSAQDARGLAPGGGTFEPESRLEGELGYGVALFGDRFTGTPNVGFGLTGAGARDWRIGWRLTSVVRGDPGFEVRLDAVRREPANDNGAGTPVEHGVMLRSAIRW